MASLTNLAFAQNPEKVSSATNSSSTRRDLRQRNKETDRTHQQQERANIFLAQMLKSKTIFGPWQSFILIAEAELRHFGGGQRS